MVGHVSKSHKPFRRRTKLRIAGAINLDGKMSTHFELAQSDTCSLVWESVYPKKLFYCWNPRYLVVKERFSEIFHDIC